MARIIDSPSKPFIDASDRWKERCLLDDLSIFSNEFIWSSDIIKEFKQVFVDQPLEGSESFFQKLKLQLSSGSLEVVKLTAELLWILYLFPSNLRQSTKSEQIRDVWSWSGEQLPEDHPMLIVFGKGIGSAGQGLANYRYRELWFMWNLITDFKSRNLAERIHLLSDPWILSNWVDSVEDSDHRIFRHLIVYLFFPDHFERIASKKHKSKIRKRFLDRAKTTDIVDSDSDFTKLDKELLSIRQSLEFESADKPVDFYWDPWQEPWRDDRQPRVWIEKTTAKNRSDRVKGEHAIGKALWSPQKNQGGGDIYKAMRQVFPGDYVIHLVDNQQFVGISKAEEIYNDKFQGVPNSEWEGPYYRVSLKEYREFEEPIPRGVIFENSDFGLPLEIVLEGDDNIFFNRKFELNQGATTSCQHSECCA